MGQRHRAVEEFQTARGLVPDDGYPSLEVLVLLR